MSSSESILLKYAMLEARLRDLRDSCEAEPNIFPVGELVRWKRGFKLGSLVDAGNLAVVLGVYERPLVADDVDPDSPDYRVPLDVELGSIDEADEFVVFRGSRAFLESASPENGRVPSLLRRAFAAFVKPSILRQGQLVAWKPFCAPAFLKRPEMPGVVVERLTGAQVGTADLPSTERGSGQPVDLAVAVEDELCGFRILWTDSRRVRAYEGPVFPGRLSREEMEDTSLDRRIDPEVSAALVAARLLGRHAQLMAPSEKPAVGAYVRWKPGLRDRVLPMVGDAAVVMDAYANPLLDSLAPVGSALWRQPFSVALGCMGEDGHFLVCHYDLRRFESLPDESNPHRPFLERARVLYRESCLFSPGNIVQWKPGLMNRTAPPDGEPAVVVEVKETAQLAAEMDGSSPYFREPLTLVVGVRDGDEFALLHVDGARFQPFQGASACGDLEWLRQRHADLKVQTFWQPGALVEWKEGFCPLLWSSPRDHGIVVDRLDPPVFVSGVSPGSSLYGVPHTVRVGFLDEDGDLVMRPVDGRRLQVASSDPDQDDALDAAFRLYVTPRDLEAGQVVEWGEGLRGWGFLDLTEESPGIVLRRLGPPVQSRQTEIFAEDFGVSADLRVGGFDDDGDFVVVHADARRLVPHRFQSGAAARRLRGFMRRLVQPKNCRAGDLVAWKDRLSTHPALPYGMPAVLLEVLENPCEFRPGNPSVSLGSPAFATPRDAVVGVWAEGRFLRLHCDVRRLEPFDAAIHGAILQRHASEEARRMDEFSRMLDDFEEDDPPF